MRGIETEKDCELLQLDLDIVHCTPVQWTMCTVYTWADEVGMVFNANAKFELLRFWQNIDDAPDILYMSSDGGPIEKKDCLRDLGGKGEHRPPFPDSD